MMYGLNGSSSNNDNFKKILESINDDKDFCQEDEEQSQHDDR